MKKLIFPILLVLSFSFRVQANDTLTYTDHFYLALDHYNKKRLTHLLMKPFIENFEYLISQKICFSNFMTLTSSNRLVRQAPKFELQNGHISPLGSLVVNLISSSFSIRLKT